MHVNRKSTRQPINNSDVTRTKNTINHIYANKSLHISCQQFNSYIAVSVKCVDELIIQVIQNLNDFCFFLCYLCLIILGFLSTIRQSIKIIMTGFNRLYYLEYKYSLCFCNFYKAILMKNSTSLHR